MYITCYFKIKITILKMCNYKYCMYGKYSNLPWSSSLIYDSTKLIDIHFFNSFYINFKSFRHVWKSVDVYNFKPFVHGHNIQGDSPSTFTSVFSLYNHTFIQNF